MNERHRTTPQLTLGFLTIDAQAAPLDVIAAAAEAGFGAAGLRISGRMPGDAWPSVDGDPAAFANIRESAGRHGVRISSISGYYITPQTTRAHLLANVRAARELGAPLIAQGCFDGDAARVGGLLRDYAAAAADAGLRIALEFMPMSELKDLAQARGLIDRAGTANVGLLIDSLHLARSGAGAAEGAPHD
jgi:sugar phosphate isomerase/epimerase